MNLVNEILQSDKGREIWQSVAPVYNNDAYHLYMFEATGTVLDDLSNFIASLRGEGFPQSSTWSLELRERLNGITSDSRLSAEERIQSLLEEMNRYQTMTDLQLERLINAYVLKKSAKVYDQEGYTFIIEIPNDTERDMARIVRVVERNKPAHLDYFIRNTSRVSLRLAGVQLTGEETTIYPYAPKDIELKTETHQATGLYTQEILEMKAKGV